MIVGFKNQATEDVFNGKNTKPARKYARNQYGELQQEN